MLTAILAVLLVLAVAHWKLHLSFAQMKADLANIIGKIEADINKPAQP